MRKPRKPYAKIVPKSAVLPELLRHLEVEIEDQDAAGHRVAARMRTLPGHLRLFRSGKIDADVFNEMEQFCRDFEMVEGGAHEIGRGGAGRLTREDVLIAATARLRRAADRIGPGAVRLVASACVLCEPAHVTARRAGYSGPIVKASARRYARKWLDDQLAVVLPKMFALDGEQAAPRPGRMRAIHAGEAAP